MYYERDGSAQIARGVNVIPVSIANGQSLSGEVDLGGYPIVAIEMPAAWTVANLTFQGSSASGGTFKDVYDDGGVEALVVAAAGRIIGVDAIAGVLAALRYIKVRSGTSGTPVNQGAARTLNLIVKG